MSNNKIIIIGAGMAGCFMALCLARRGYKVEVYEYRPDVRKEPYDSGRSFNLTLYYRGILAMQQMGVWDEIKKIATIAEGNVAHYGETKNVYSAFDGQADEVLYTVHRNQLNSALITLAEQEPNIKLFFNTRCVAINKKTKTLTFQKEGQNKTFTTTATMVIGADGIHSMVRSEIQKAFDVEDPRRRASDTLDTFDTFENESWGYKEVHVSPELAKKMDWRLNATHTWPRPESLLIAFPNPDKSFTLMFNLPLEGEGSFASLVSKEQIAHYIKGHFPDLTPLLTEIIQSFLTKPTGNFTTLKTSPWYYQDFMVLIGDAAHAVIPFYGQGVCAAFEDCLKLSELINQHNPNRHSGRVQNLSRSPNNVTIEPYNNWESIFSSYQQSRKPNTDLLAELSKENFIELRDKSRSMFYIFKDKADTLLHRLFPKLWLPPLYVLIAHGSLEYVEAIRRHKKQQQLSKKIGLDFILATITIPWIILRKIKS